jgi:hypothetical protein
MLNYSLPVGQSAVAVRYSSPTDSSGVEATFGADAQRVFLEFRLTLTGRRVRVETADGTQLPQRELGDSGAVSLIIDDEPAVRLRVQDTEVFAQDGATPFIDERLVDFYEPIRQFAQALPEQLQRRVDRARTTRAEPGKLADDDGFWGCVGQAVEYGAEMGGTVGFIAGTAVGALAGGAPAILTGPAGALAGAAGGAAAGFLGGVAIC